MFLACVLLVIATLSGILLTFLFDRTAPLSARLCMGACYRVGDPGLDRIYFLPGFRLSAASLALW